MIKKKIEEQNRLSLANQFITTISSCGRRFFYDENHNRIAILELDERGRVWFRDDYTDKRIYTHLPDKRWRGFSHGGSLKQLVIALRDYIKKGETLNLSYFVNKPKGLFGCPWGYDDESMTKVHDFAEKMGVAS